MVLPQAGTGRGFDGWLTAGHTTAIPTRAITSLKETSNECINQYDRI